jgi:hypothetical protein
MRIPLESVRNVNLYIGPEIDRDSSDRVLYTPQHLNRLGEAASAAGSIISPEDRYVHADNVIILLTPIAGWAWLEMPLRSQGRVTVVLPRLWTSSGRCVMMRTALSGPESLVGSQTSRAHGGNSPSLLDPISGLSADQFSARCPPSWAMTSSRTTARSSHNGRSLLYLKLLMQMIPGRSCRTYRPNLY